MGAVPHTRRCPGRRPEPFEYAAVDRQLAGTAGYLEVQRAAPPGLPAAGGEIRGQDAVHEAPVRLSVGELPGPPYDESVPAPDRSGCLGEAGVQKRGVMPVRRRARMPGVNARASAPDSTRGAGTGEPVHLADAVGFGPHRAVGNGVG
ncbi:hypothetical protein OG568_59880 (plasmid) [Streptomyces sp. NBC_01450]|uniref:hypothetical protein n=1 Tax=Streptomyces sp. NBC_01450 TaxID=2903871 RepID=UPI002E2F74AE|nr:hypothetical protein [Streptomyces sp. NBC_01450]